MPPRPVKRCGMQGSDGVSRMGQVWWQDAYATMCIKL
jgi:hypothetical protein